MHIHTPCVLAFWYHKRAIKGNKGNHFLLFFLSAREKQKVQAFATHDEYDVWSVMTIL